MENLNAYTGIIVLFAILWAVQLYRAWKRFYRSDELFVRTPGHDMANVEKKHVRIWVKNAVAIVAVLFAIFVLNAMLDLYASEEVKRIFKNCENMLLVPFLLPSLVLGWDTRNYYLPSIFWDRKPYIVTRYMVYPERKISTVFATMVSCSIFGGLAAFVCGMSGQGVGISEAAANSPLAVVCLVIEFFAIYLVNYNVIAWYEETSNDFLFADVSEADYDKAARRYYGIWRNRLLLANLIAGAQLIFGGFVTMTQSGNNLMTLRIVGLAIISAFFTYVFYQGRNFENPIVVKGMVYPSEKKRVALKWATLIAIALYIIAILIFA